MAESKKRISREERRIIIERQLLAAAERLMADGASFTELSVERLAREAGISRATFYIYFEDKGHLLRQLTGQAFADFTDAANNWWTVVDRHDPADTESSVRGIIAAFRDHQHLMNAVGEMASYTPGVADTLRTLMDSVIKEVESVIEAGKDAGIIRPDLPAHATATALSWMVERTCSQVIPGGDPHYDEDLARAMTEIVWSTLYLTPLAGPKAVTDS